MSYRHAGMGQTLIEYSKGGPARYSKGGVRPWRGGGIVSPTDPRSTYPGPTYYSMYGDDASLVMPAPRQPLSAVAVAGWAAVVAIAAGVFWAVTSGKGLGRNPRRRRRGMRRNARARVTWQPGDKVKFAATPADEEQGFMARPARTGTVIRSGGGNMVVVRIHRDEREGGDYETQYHRLDLKRNPRRGTRRMVANPSYKTRDPRGWGGDPKRGAAMGRHTRSEPGSNTFKKPLTLRRIPLHSGGYDPNGTYFGWGEPIYWLASDDGTIDRVMRARNRAEAKTKARELYPQARFFR